MNEWSKKSEKSGKIYHVRNVIGRENFITCGRVNVLAYALWTEYNRSVVQTLGQQNVNRQHYALHYLAIRHDVGKCTQTCTYI